MKIFIKEEYTIYLFNFLFVKIIFINPIKLLPQNQIIMRMSQNVFRQADTIK
jgi:hypothetical protein